jgi:hypothetical protein
MKGDVNSGRNVFDVMDDAEIQRLLKRSDVQKCLKMSDSAFRE